MTKKTTTSHSAAKHSTAWLVRCISILLVCVLLAGCGIPGGSDGSKEIIEEPGAAQSKEIGKATEKTEMTETVKKPESAETAEAVEATETTETTETAKEPGTAKTAEKSAASETVETTETAETAAAEHAGISAQRTGATQTSETAEPKPESLAGEASVEPQSDSLTEEASAEPQSDSLTGEASAEPQTEALTEEQKTEKMIHNYLGNLSLEDKVSGLFIITPEQLTGYDVVTEADELVQESLEKYPVAGLIFFGQNIVDRDQVLDMLASTKEWGSVFPEKEIAASTAAESAATEEESSATTAAERTAAEEEPAASTAAESAAEGDPEAVTAFPPFLAIDEEGGNVMRIGSSAIDVPYVGSMGSVGATGDPEAAYEAGSTIGAYLQELGFNLDLAPDADVLVDPANVTIGDRSFGSDPELCGQMVHRYVDGLHENRIASCIKHFPGLGDTESDTHTGAAWSSRTIEDYRSTEFLSFGGGIDAGTEMVMISHLSNSELSGSDLPASLNKTIVTDILRTELEFEGIVITDSLRMGAVTEQFSSAEAAVTAVEAGVDILLMSADFHAARQGILDAVHDGRISEERIDESLFRILRARAALADS